MRDEGYGDAVIAKVVRRIVPFIGLLFFLAFLDRVNVGFAALQMNADLGLTPLAFGVGSGIFFIGYVLFEIPSNVILERVGARRWIARIMVTWGLVSAAMAFAQGPISFYVLRFLLGVAEAGFFPGIVLYLTYWFPQRYRGRVIGAFLIALPLSTIVGAPLSTALMQLEGFGLRGWQWMFLLEGLPTALIGFLVLAWLPDRPHDAKWLKAEERDWLTNEYERERAALGAGHGTALRSALLDRRIWTLGAIYFGLLVSLYGIGFWLPQIIRAFGDLSTVEIGLLTVVPYLLAAIVMRAWGRHSDATRERVWHVAAPTIVGAIGFAAGGVFADSPTLCFAALTLGAIGIHAALPVFWTLPTALFTGTAAAGGIALVNSLGNVGGFVGPTAIGWVRDSTGSYEGALLLLAGLSASAAAIVIVAVARWTGARGATASESTVLRARGAVAAAQPRDVGPREDSREQR